MKDSEAENLFSEWWYTFGSGIIPLPEHDLEAHSKRVCERAYMAGYLEGKKADK